MKRIMMGRGEKPAWKHGLEIELEETGDQSNRIARYIADIPAEPH